MKILSGTTRGLFIVCLPLLFFAASIAWAINSPWVYTSGFEDQNVGATTGLSREELAKVARGFIGYWNSGDEYINLTVIKNGRPFELFNEREVDHLKDVKALFRFDYRVLLATGLYALGYLLYILLRRKKQGLRQAARDVARGSALTLLLMLALGLVALLGADGFANFWYRFHVLSFANDLWLLDPTKDYLVMLVPEGFWYTAVRDIVLATAGMAIVPGGAAVAHLLYRRAE